jgi:lysophospholipase L1-like esterase
MKKYLLLVFSAFSFIFVFPAQVKKNPDLSDKQKVKKILFLGNSITYQGNYITDIETYYITHFPKQQFEFINVGLPSETVSGLSEPNHADGRFPRPDLHERLERILELIQPDIVFACYGMNDGIYLPLDQQRFQQFRDGILWMHNRLAKTGARIIHLTPPVYDDKRAGAAGYNSVLDYYSTWLLQQRDSLHWEVADIHFPMAIFLEENRKINPGFVLADDGVHPGELGHWIMAKQVLLYLGFKKDVADANEVKDIYANQKNGEAIYKLVAERQLIMKDAWLTATKHTRPEMPVGLPLDEAKTKASTIETQIRKLN